MKSAVISAVVAALVASGSTYAATRINGRSIRPHSIPLNRLTHNPPRGLNPATVSVAVGDDVSVSADGIDTSRAYCSAGYAILGGGGDVDPNGRITGSHPVQVDGAQGWEITVLNDTGAPMTAHAYAVCAP